MKAVKSLPDTSLPLWGSAKKILFRFFFILLGFVTLLGLIRLLPGHMHLLLLCTSLLSKPLYWLNLHFYHIAYNPDKASLVNDDDTPINWLISITFLWVSAICCIIWSIADKRRRNYNKLDYWFRTWLAYYLYIAMIGYAVAKIVVAQMPFPNAESLLEPLGNKERIDILWGFIGISPGYSVFTGICELLAAFLVLCRRTRVIGCCIMAAILVNVVCFNVFYNIIVKLLSIQLLLVNLYLVVPYIVKLVDFFYYHKPVSLTERQYVFSTPLKKYLMLALLLIPAWQTFSSIHHYINLRNKDWVRLQQKVYDVTSFVNGNDTLLPLLTDTFRIKQLVFTAYHNNKYAVVYSMKDEPTEYYYNWDSAHKNITLLNGKDSTKKSLFNYTELPQKQLSLTGQWKGQNITMLLNRFEIDSMPLMKEKIKWIQDN